jgi:hypothetical protein
MTDRWLEKCAREVARGLFVGSKPPPGRRNVDVIILAAMEYQPSADLFPGIEVIHAPLDDDSERPMTDEEITIAARAAAIVGRRLHARKRVLASCMMGWNRSALIAGLAMRGMSADQIITRIRLARGPYALSNPNFVRLIRVMLEVRGGPSANHALARASARRSPALDRR